MRSGDAEAPPPARTPTTANPLRARGLSPRAFTAKRRTEIRAKAKLSRDG